MASEFLRQLSVRQLKQDISHLAASVCRARSQEAASLYRWVGSYLRNYEPEVSSDLISSVRVRFYRNLFQMSHFAFLFGRRSELRDGEIKFSSPLHTKRDILEFLQFDVIPPAREWCRPRRNKQLL